MNSNTLPVKDWDSEKLKQQTVYNLTVEEFVYKTTCIYFGFPVTMILPSTNLHLPGKVS